MSRVAGGQGRVHLSLGCGDLVGAAEVAAGQGVSGRVGGAPVRGAACSGFGAGGVQCQLVVRLCGCQGSIRGFRGGSCQVQRDRGDGTLRLEQAVVQAEERIAGLHHVTFVHRHCGDFAADLRRKGDADGFDGTGSGKRAVILDKQGADAKVAADQNSQDENDNHGNGRTFVGHENSF